MWQELQSIDFSLWADLKTVVSIGTIGTSKQSVVALGTMDRNHFLFIAPGFEITLSQDQRQNDRKLF